MGKVEPPVPVKMFIGLLTGRLNLLPQLYQFLEDELGPIDYSSEVMDFNFTQYYEEEMGCGLKRQFLSFLNLVLPDRLAEIKLFTNSLERKWSEGGRRTVNLDPGYLNSSRVVLASTKDYSHRIYLGRGIYAEITLTYHRKKFEPLPWTYPDYRTKAYHQVLLAIRAKYVEQIKGLSSAFRSP